MLVANAYLMRPELFGAVHCAAPILDLKRFIMMGGEDSWKDEFGDPETKDWDSFLKKFSPYHNVDQSTKKYPPILLTTNARDAQVHPGHARKMVKLLWEKGQGKKWPAYYYETMEGGSTNAEQYAFVTSLAYEFLFKTLSKVAEKS